MHIPKPQGLAGAVSLLSTSAFSQFMLVALMALLIVLSPTVLAQSQSTDATLSGLTLSDVDFGTFASGTTTYTASVASTVTGTTVTPTTNHSAATFAIKLGGVTDDDGEVTLSSGDNVITIEVTAEDGQTTQTYTVTVTRTASTDATLSALTLSDVTIRTFSSNMTHYSLRAANRVTQTTVTPTLGDSRASYVIKLGGAEDTDGVVSLAQGWNEITVEVTAEDGTTTKTYTVSVFRYDARRDGTLLSLSLSGVDIGWGHHGVNTRSYSGNAAYSLTETTVDPYVLSGDTYVIKLDGVEDDDGVIPLATGDNVITVEVTSYDGQSTNTYTVTVTRADAASSDATLDGLAMSGINLGIGLGRAAYGTNLKANVYHSVSETTVTPETNHPFATYVIKLDGVEDTDGEISLAVGSNIITVEVTAEDDTTTKTYTATINRAAADDPTTGVLSTDDPPMNFRVLHASPSYIQLGLAFPRNRGITTWESERYHHNGTEFVESGVDGIPNQSASPGAYTTVGTGLGTGSSPTRGALYKYTVTFKNSEGATVIEESMTVRVPSFGRSIFDRLRAQSPESQQADASLSDLTLSGIAIAQDQGGTICCGINRGDYTTVNSEQQSYEGRAPNSVSETTITPTLSQSGASYVIKKGGVTDDDGTVTLDLGTNFITIEVTAPDETHFRTYYLTITRVEAGSATDATLSGLTLSGIDFGTFSSDTTSYAVTVADTVSATTVTPTLNDSDASYDIWSNLSSYPYHSSTPSVRLYKGTNDITVRVTAEDDATTKTYTVAVARGQAFVVSGVTSSSLTENNSNFKQYHWAERNERAIERMDVTWSLTGDDSDDFSIAEADDGSKRAILTFTSTPNYERPTDADADNVYEVTISASDGTNTATKNVTITVKDEDESEPNSPATGAPTISGTPQVGQSLTASTSGISDSDGLTNVSYSYQWLADDTEIDGATSSTYTLQASDNGKVIKVRVSFTDDERNSESLTSAGTSAVVLGGM